MAIGSGRAKKTTYECGYCLEKFRGTDNGILVPYSTHLMKAHTAIHQLLDKKKQEIKDLKDEYRALWNGRHWKNDIGRIPTFLL